MTNDPSIRPCDSPHPHDGHPCGRKIIDGVTRCQFCGLVDGDPMCGCWTHVSEVLVDWEHLEVWMSPVDLTGDG